MKKSLREECNQAWKDFRKNMTWNEIKMYVCSSILPGLFLYGYTFWIKLVDPIMDSHNNPKTPEESIISLCLVIGFVAPVFLMFPLLDLGYQIGRLLRFFKDDKTRTVWWDNITYFVKDMPDEERQKIAAILSPYKSKLQLRKEERAKLSWFRRNFT